MYKEYRRQIMNKKFGVVSSVVVILGIGLSFATNEMNTEAAPIKKCSVSFNTEKETKITPSMIEHALEKKYHVSDKKLTFEKGQKNLTHTGNYHVDLIEKDSFLHETKLSTSVSFTDQTGPHIKQLKDTLEYGASISPNHLYEAKDKIDGNCPVTIHQLDTHKLGKQSVKVTSKDHSGNKSKESFEVTVLNASVGKFEESSIEDTAVSPTKVTKVPVDTNQVEGSNTTDKTVSTKDATTFSSETGNQQQAVVSTLSFLGATIPFVHANGAGSTPATGCGTWTGMGGC